MLDESIESSPRKGNRSIHHARIHRKIKRQGVDESMDTLLAPIGRQQLQDDEDYFHSEARLPDLLALYETEEVTSASSKNGKWSTLVHCELNEHFDPFAEERLLLLADQVEHHPRYSGTLTATQGFLPCNRLVHNANNVPDEVVAVTKSSNHFEITDSELLQVCEENEKQQTSLTTERETCVEPKETPQRCKPKSVVDMILEDFCSSPMSPELHSSEDSTFCFKYTGKCIRTYGRQQRPHISARQNIAQQFAQPPIEDDDILSTDSSSGLSIQEDLTLLQTTLVPEVIDIQNSQNVCENLRNLSAYFKQLSQEKQKQCNNVEDPAKQESSNEKSSTETSPQKEICTNSAKEFESNSAALHGLLEIINLRTQFPVSFNSNRLHSSVEEFNGFSSDTSDAKSDKSVKATCKDPSASTNRGSNNENSNENIKANGSGQVQHNENLFIDDDYEWNDECDFFPSIDARNVVSAQNILQEEQGIRESCESKFPNGNKIWRRERSSSSEAVIDEVLQAEETHIPQHSRRVSAELSSGNPALKCNTTSTGPILVCNEENVLPINDPYSHKSVGFKTASSKSIHISEDAQERAMKILQDLPQFCAEEFTAASSKPKAISEDDQEHTPVILQGLSVAFRTASSKSIMISEQAQKDAAKILQNLPHLTTDEGQTDDICLSTKQLPVEFKPCSSRSINPSKKGLDLLQLTTANKETNDSTSGNMLVRFKTASSKSIKISENAQKRATKILQDLPQLPAKENQAAEISSSAKEFHTNMPFVGFKTASSKYVNISKEAQERAAKILQDLPPLSADTNQKEEKYSSIQKNCENDMFMGLRTASNKSIAISKEAQECAAKLFQAAHAQVVDNFQDLSNDAGASLKRLTENFDTELLSDEVKDIVFSEWPLGDEFIESENTDMPKEKALSGTTVNKQALNTDMKQNEEYLPVDGCIETRNVNIVKEETLSSNVVKEEVTNTEMGDFAPIEENIDVKNTDMPKEVPLFGITAKRKVSNADFEQNEESLAGQTPKVICKSLSMPRSPLRHLQNGAIHSSLSELAMITPPNYRPSKAIISRRNLLSLNRHNKYKKKSLAADPNLNNKSSYMDTPIRTNPNISNNVVLVEDHNPHSQTHTSPSTPTPNLQEFFKSVTMNTSTPYPQSGPQTRNRTRLQKGAVLQAASTPVAAELELKRIDWEHENTAGSPCRNTRKLSNTSDSNITHMESNPTPKQRIDRLRMYGKPPNLSPIFMSSSDNCRISGLRRRNRSLVKH